MSQNVTVTLARVEDTTIEGAARQHRVVIDRPEAKGGRDQGPMGGELLLLGLGRCSLSNLIAAAKAREVLAEDLRVTVTADLHDAPPRFTAVELRDAGRWNDRPAMEKLKTIAERGCLCANTVKKVLQLNIVLD